MKNNSVNRAYLGRRSSFNFDNSKDFDMKAFKKVLKVFSSNMPSKQHKYPYQLDIIDWSDKDLRREIFYGTMPDPTDVKCMYNNQILAPVLISFTHEFPGENIAPVEIGMAVMALTLLLHSNGFSTSFCECIEDPNYLGKLITNKESTVRVFLCVGQHVYNQRATTMPNPFGEQIATKWDKQKSIFSNIKYHIDKK